MKLLGALAAITLAVSPRAFTVDEAKPYGRAAAAVSDSAARTETALAPESKAGPGRTVLVHLDANSPCEALVVAFTQEDRNLAFGWRPVMVTLPEWEERAVGNEKWPWNEAGGVIEIFVLFFAPASAQAAEIRQLVTLMQDSKSAAKLLEAQSNKLHELIGRAIADKDRSKYRVRTEPAEIAGVMRGSAFPWRQFAGRANFTPDEPGVLIFSTAPAQ